MILRYIKGDEQVTCDLINPFMIIYYHVYQKIKKCQFPSRTTISNKSLIRGTIDARLFFLNWLVTKEGYCNSTRKRKGSWPELIRTQKKKGKELWRLEIFTPRLQPSKGRRNVLMKIRILIRYMASFWKYEMT
jgi:hypothetical protein